MASCFLFLFIGSFSFRFNTLGTYYYWSTTVDRAGLITLRGVITVVDSQPLLLTVQASSNSFTGTCMLHFSFYIEKEIFFVIY